MERVNLFFLHGFLGRPSDWDSIASQISNQSSVNVFKVDYLNEDSLCPDQSFEEWAQSFDRWVLQLGVDGQSNFLIGYSLGGRLALHALEKNPALWRKVILLSTNPGFKENQLNDSEMQESRQQRILQDKAWASKFLNLPWEVTVKDWNLLPVFQGGVSEPQRIEGDYSKRSLEQSLVNWSLAKQKDLRPVIAKNREKIVWLVGERDVKYLELGMELETLIVGFKVDIIAKASHRIHFDCPEATSKKIQSLI